MRMFVEEYAATILEGIVCALSIVVTLTILFNFGAMAFDLMMKVLG